MRRKLLEIHFRHLRKLFQAQAARLPHHDHAEIRHNAVLVSKRHRIANRTDQDQIEHPFLLTTTFAPVFALIKRPRQSKRYSDAGHIRTVFLATTLRIHYCRRRSR